jgi:hypothetical protein
MGSCENRGLGPDIKNRKVVFPTHTPLKINSGLSEKRKKETKVD